MPFKSQAQRAKFAELVKQGKIKQTTFDEWNSATPKDIPKKVTSKKSPRWSGVKKAVRK